MGKRRRPRPINHHVAPKAAGYWGPRRSALAPWLRREAMSERALGPGATIGILGMGVPRLACLRPRAWLHQWPGTSHLHQQPLKTLARGQASRGGGRKTSSGITSLGWLLRSGDIYARGTSRGARYVSRDDQGQVGASGRRVPVASLVLKGQAQARSPEAKVTISVQRDQDQQDGSHRGARDGVTTRAFGR